MNHTQLWMIQIYDLQHLFWTIQINEPLFLFKSPNLQWETAIFNIPLNRNLWLSKIIFVKMDGLQLCLTGDPSPSGQF